MPASARAAWEKTGALTGRAPLWVLTAGFQKRKKKETDVIQRGFAAGGDGRGAIKSAVIQTEKQLPRQQQRHTYRQQRVPCLTGVNLSRAENAALRCAGSESSTKEVAQERKKRARSSNWDPMEKQSQTLSRKEKLKRSHKRLLPFEDALDTTRGCRRRRGEAKEASHV